MWRLKTATIIVIIDLNVLIHQIDGSKAMLSNSIFCQIHIVQNNMFN